MKVIKTIFKWAFRLVCLAIICAACYTLGISLLHMHDDHSYEALMADNTVETFQMDATVNAPVAENQVVEEVDENPNVVLECAETLSAAQPYVTVSAAFTNIQSAITADLNWYVGDQLVSSDTDRLLVEGSVVNVTLSLNAVDRDLDEADVVLNVLFQEKTLEARKTIDVTRLESGASGQVQTSEIPVKIIANCYIYSDATMETQTGYMKEGENGVLVGYENLDSGKVLELQLADGSDVWVESSNAEISSELYIMDGDYDDATKESFVNGYNYSSHTDYLVWVSIYTQQVCIFSGYQGNWQLERSFDCSTGANETPTTTGVFTYSDYDTKWDLGEIYVAPAMIFNGGEAFTSLPYKTEDDTLYDSTIGTPVSGGSVRLAQEDIDWMLEEIPVGTRVVVY